MGKCMFMRKGSVHTDPLLPPIGKSLNDYTWEEINIISSRGVASKYFSVGDTKAVHIKGTIGILTVDATYYVYIIGINHNGSTGIDFGTFKTAASGGIDVCLIDKPSTSAPTDGTKCFNMNHNGNTNTGGWNACDIRYDILGSTNLSDGNASATTATNPVANTLMAALPSDLRAVMKPMTIYTDNTGGSSDTASNVTTTVDYLPLLSEFEVHGSRKYANSTEQNFQAQYAYYSAGNSKKKFSHTATTSNMDWWLRSPCHGYDVGKRFCIGYRDGSKIDCDMASYARGLAPIFRV